MSFCRLVLLQVLAALLFIAAGTASLSAQSKKQLPPPPAHAKSPSPAVTDDFVHQQFDENCSLLAGPPLGAVLFQALSVGLGILLLAGLWTPVAGTLVAAEALWNVFSSGHPWRWIMLATLGAALALIGPGAWSIDARLFGWRRLEIRDRKSQDSPP